MTSNLCYYMLIAELNGPNESALVRLIQTDRTVWPAVLLLTTSLRRWKSQAACVAGPAAAACSSGVQQQPAAPPRSSGMQHRHAAAVSLAAVESAVFGKWTRDSSAIQQSVFSYVTSRRTRRKGE